MGGEIAAVATADRSREYLFAVEKITIEGMRGQATIEIHCCNIDPWDHCDVDGTVRDEDWKRGDFLSALESTWEPLLGVVRVFAGWPRDKMIAAKAREVEVRLPDRAGMRAVERLVDGDGPIKRKWGSFRAELCVRRQLENRDIDRGALDICLEVLKEDFLWWGKPIQNDAELLREMTEWSEALREPVSDLWRLLTEAEPVKVVIREPFWEQACILREGACAYRTSIIRVDKRH